MEHEKMLVHRLPLDDGTADRLAAGRLPPQDAPPGYAAVARALTAAGDGLTNDEVDDELLVSMVRAVETSPPNVGNPSMISRLRSTKVGTIAAAVVLATTGVAAAAGTLPGPAQDATSAVLSHMGLDLPTSGDDHPTGHADNPTDRDAHGAAISELARTAAATGADKGAAISAAARAGHGPDAAVGEEEPTETADDADGIGENGKPVDPGSQGPVATPNGGGTGTAGEASGGHSEVGTVNAPDQPAAGSGYADEPPSGVDHPTADDNPGTEHRPAGRP